MNTNNFKDPKVIGIGIFLLFLLLGLLGLGFIRNDPPAPMPPVPTVSAVNPTNNPTGKPMKMETFYLTPTPTL